MYIYKITNKENGKVYIGQSIRPIEQRFSRHINDAVNCMLDTHLARAIRKHGQLSFAIELIDIASSQDELNIKERQWIRYYESTDPRKGYNETDALYKCGGNTYKSKTSSEMEKISERLSRSKIGYLNPNATKVKCKNVKTGDELVFDTVKECMEYFGENTHRFITTRCRGDVSSLYKGEWAIAYANCDYKYKTFVNKTGKRVVAKDNESHKLFEFESIRLLCRELELNRSAVQKGLNKNDGKEIVCGNYTISVID